MTKIKTGDRVSHELLGEGKVSHKTFFYSSIWHVAFDNGIYADCAESSLTLLKPERRCTCGGKSDEFRGASIDEVNSNGGFVGTHHFDKPCEVTPELGFEVGDTVEANGERVTVKSIDYYYADRVVFAETLGKMWMHFLDPSNPWHFTKVSRPTTFTVSKEISVAEYEAHLKRNTNHGLGVGRCYLMLSAPSCAEVDAAYREQVGE